MTTFSPSPQFAKRWLATPDVIKKAFRQELTDIIDMLHGQTPAHEFEFNYSNFGQTLGDLFFVHKDETKLPIKIIHHLENSHHVDNASLKDDDLSIIEQRITKKLSMQIDDFLSEHMSQLSDDLKAWLQSTIKNELANYKKD